MRDADSATRRAKSCEILPPPRRRQRAVLSALYERIHSAAWHVCSDMYPRTMGPARSLAEGLRTLND